jgi:predicted nucleotide-binding protein
VARGVQLGRLERIRLWTRTAGPSTPIPNTPSAVSTPRPPHHRTTNRARERGVEEVDRRGVVEHLPQTRGRHGPAVWAANILELRRQVGEAQPTAGGAHGAAMCDSVLYLTGGRMAPTTSPQPSPRRAMLARPRAEVEKEINERILIGLEMQKRLKQNPAEQVKFLVDAQKWRDFNLDFLENAATDKSLRNEYYRAARESYVDISGPEIPARHIPMVSGSVGQQIIKLESIHERLRFYDPTLAQPAATSINTKGLSKVFVVHGHDEGALQAMARFLGTIGLQAIVLREQPDQGRTTIEKFEACASEVGFAVALFTPDDFGGPVAAPKQAARARQNVIFELGYFVGSLGRGRACLLRKGDVEIPSDLVGVIYTDMDHPAEGWKVKLARELRAAGFEFDAGKVLA